MGWRKLVTSNGDAANRNVRCDERGGGGTGGLFQKKIGGLWILKTVALEFEYCEIQMEMNHGQSKYQ